MVEGDISLALDGYSSSFTTYELEPGIYNFKDLSKAVFNVLQPEHVVFNNSVDIELDDITMKTKLVVSLGNITVRFFEKSFY